MVDETRSFIDLLHARAPREQLEQLVADADRGGSPAAAGLRAELPRALQLHDTLERQRRREAELSGLYATASDLTSIRDLNQILLAIVRRTRQLLDTDIAYIALSDANAQAARILVTDGSVSDSFANLEMEFGTGLLGLVAQSGQPYATSDYHVDDRFAHRHYIDSAVTDESIHAILGVPMLVDGVCIGALLAANRTPRPFPAEEVQLLGSFAAHAAIALENARLFEEVGKANEQLRERSAAVERAADVHDRLTAVLLRGGDSADVAEVLSRSLRSVVGVLAPDGETLARTDGDPLPTVSDEVTQEALESGHAIAVRHDNGVVGGWVAAASAGRDHLATLVCGRGDLDEADIRTFERAAVVTALLRMLVRTAAEAENRVRADLLDDLLNTPLHDPDRLRERARRQNVALDDKHVLLVIDAGETGRRQQAEAVARLTITAGGLSGSHRSELVLALPGDDPMTTGRRVHERVSGLDGTVTIGAAGPVRGPHEWAEAYRNASQCRHALVALGRAGEVADPRSIGFARLLLGGSGPREVDDFLDATIGPLLTYDETRGTDLTRTLDRWYEAGGNAAAASRELHLHVNTVNQRLERVTALIGSSWREPATSLDVRLALRIWRLGAHVWSSHFSE